MFTAFLIGLFGSLHCVGMCGPLVMAMPFRDKNGDWKAGPVLSYHGGKMLTYAVLGIGMGLIGGGLRLFFLQQWISICSGVLLLLIYFFPVLFGRSRFPVVTSYWNKNVVTKMKALLQPREGQSSTIKLFNLGLVNGLLPCGLVYMALIGAVSQPTLIRSALFMAVFGLGTSPALSAVIISKKALLQRVRFSYRRWVPVFVVVISAMLIVRGLGLGIPYVSPANENSCCHKQVSSLNQTPKEQTLYSLYDKFQNSSTFQGDVHLQLQGDQGAY